MPTEARKHKGHARRFQLKLEKALQRCIATYLLTLLTDTAQTMIAKHTPAARQLL